jgi:predicted methyltransferase
VERIIQKLKDDGRNYTNNQFLRMLQLIGRTNVIDINLNTPIISSITRLSGLLNAIDDENDEVVERSLRELILNTLDTFDIASHETSKEVKALNNYLVRGIETMKEELVEFIEKNYGTSIPKSSIRKATQFISNLSRNQKRFVL